MFISYILIYVSSSLSLWLKMHALFMFCQTAFLCLMLNCMIVLEHNLDAHVLWRKHYAEKTKMEKKISERKKDIITCPILYTYLGSAVDVLIIKRDICCIAMGTQAQVHLFYRVSDLYSIKI
ncbi:hypothetical protein ACJX0J_012056 [Zea mays]